MCKIVCNNALSFVLFSDVPNCNLTIFEIKYLFAVQKELDHYQHNNRSGGQLLKSTTRWEFHLHFLLDDKFFTTMMQTFNLKKIFLVSLLFFGEVNFFVFFCICPVNEFEILWWPLFMVAHIGYFGFAFCCALYYQHDDNTPSPNYVSCSGFLRCVCSIPGDPSSFTPSGSVVVLI